MYSAHNRHISETLVTQNITKIIQNSNNLIEVPQSTKSDSWLVKFGITCHICQIVWHNKSEFDTHFRRDHDGTVTYTCTPCGKQMDNYHNYRSHCYRHGTQLKCPHCDKAYPQLSRLVTHVNANHLGKTEENEDTISVRTKRDFKKKLFECPECFKKLVSVSGLQFHIKTNHQSELQLAASQDFICKECGKVLKSLAGLQSHIAVHQSAKQYACNLCEKRFLQPAALQKHTQTEHTGHKPYSCSLCSLEFDTESSLKKHLPFHNNERKFPCTVCNKCFKTKRCLKVHSRLHLKVTSDLPCPTCGKRFLNSTKLRQHVNIHNGERPYSCKYCTLTFTNFPNWMKHTRCKHKVDHKTGEPLADLQSKEDKKNISQKTINSAEQNMSKENGKELFDATYLCDDANQETINTVQTLTPFSAKKHNFDKNGNYKDEIKNDSKTSNMYESSCSINFSNFHKRVKLDQVLPNKTALQDETIAAKNHSIGFTPDDINLKSKTMALCRNRSVKFTNDVYSDNVVQCDSISLNSKEQTNSGQPYSMQRDFTPSVDSMYNKTVSFINDEAIPLETSRNIPILVMGVPTTNSTNILSSTLLNTINNYYTSIGQNTIELKPSQPVNVDKTGVQMYLNDNVEQKNNKMSKDQPLNGNGQAQNELTENIIIIYNDFQEKDCINNNKILTQIGLDKGFSNEKQFMNKNVEQIFTENHVIPGHKYVNHVTKKYEIINNNNTYEADNSILQEKILEPFNVLEQQNSMSQDLVNKNKVEEQVVKGDNMMEEKMLIGNHILQAELCLHKSIVKKQEFINIKEKNVLTNVDMVDTHIRKAQKLGSKEMINIPFTEIELFKNNIVQLNESVKEITNDSIAEVMHLLNQNISDGFELIDNKKSQEQELVNKKLPQQKEYVNEKSRQYETVLNKIYRQEDLGLYKNNISHEMLNNKVTEKHPERDDFVSENCQRKTSDVTYSSVNLTSALGLDEGSLLAHINPHLTIKLTQHSESHTSLSELELHSTNDVFTDNTCDSIPESLLASDTDTPLINCRNLRMMTQDDTQASQEPMDIFDQDELDFINIDVQDVFETLKNITALNETVDSFLNLKPINEMLDVSKEPQPYISGDFLVVPPSLEM